MSIQITVGKHTTYGAIAFSIGVFTGLAFFSGSTVIGFVNGIVVGILAIVAITTDSKKP